MLKFKKEYWFLVLFIQLSFYVIANNKTINNSEIGHFSVKNFSIEDYNSLPQIWSVTQDKRNIIYIANRDGILQFDGTNWEKIKIEEDLIGRSLAAGKDGKIYVGSENEFGFLTTTPQGKMIYKSLLPLLENKEIVFGDIWKVFSVNESIIFQSSKHFFVYSEGKIKVVQDDFNFDNSFVINDMVFILNYEKGLFRLLNNKLKLIESSEFLGHEKLYILLPYNYNILYGVTNTGGVYLINYIEDKNLINSVKKETQIDDFIKSTQLYSGIKLADNVYSIGSFKGSKVINVNGDYLFEIDKKTGCIDENIKYQFLDNNNRLWLGLSNGISCINANSSISQFSDKHNINGTIESITRHEGKIVIATSVGAYYLQQVGHDYLFKQIKGISASETWITKSFNVEGDPVLLIEQNEKVHSVKKSKIKELYYGIPWALYQIEEQGYTFIIGHENGASIKSFNGYDWENKGDIRGISKRITDIVKYQNQLWLSAEVEGIYQIKDFNKEETTITFYNDSILNASGPFVFQKFEDTLLIGTGDGILCFDKHKDRIQYSSLNILLGDKPRYIHRMSVDYDGKLWIGSYIESEEREEIGFFEYNQDSVLYWNATPFQGEIKGQINAIYHDTNGVTWLGGNEGLFRYDSRKEISYDNSFYCLVRKVRFGEDSTYFHGNYFDANGVVSLKQPISLNPILKYEYNSLIFDYSALNIEVNHLTQYSYYLEGYDKKWSEWSNETKKEYTNLHEGQYTFRVKARNIYQFESSEGNFKFEILPPWYRTWWAYILIVLVAIFVVYVIVTQYTKYLRAIIRENTAEIRAQKDEIEKQKDEITASIKYAERIQKAIVPTAERAKELLPEHFVLWRPRDIVSGDFWWMTEKNGLVAIVAADCTGHGVPGAFVSMLGVSFLNEIVGKMETLKANEILDQLRLHVKTTMKQTGKEGESKDGMDIALIVLDIPNNQIQYAGAYNPLFLIRNGELLETKATRNPIGIYIKEVPFDNHILDVQKGDTLYIFSDGFVDQFGGDKGSKFKTKNFKNLLLEIQEKPMLEQKDILDKTVDDWRGEIEQVDDIIIVGIRM